LGCKEREIQDQREMDDNGNLQLPSLPNCHPEEKMRQKHLCQALIQKCFPPDRSSLSHSLHDTITTNICHQINCDIKRVEVRGLRTRLYYVIVALVFMLLIIFYIERFVRISLL